MSRWRYHYCGVRIASMVELPEWQAFAAPDDGGVVEVEILVRAGIALAPALGRDGDDLIFGIAGIADYRVGAARRILLTTADGRADRTARLYLLGSAWGALGYQRGWFPLHAGVVALAGRAIAICAPSGGGKSSLVAALLGRGIGVFSDDLCRLEIAPAPRVWRSLPVLKLTRETLARLPQLAVLPDLALPPGEDKHRYSPSEVPVADTLPLRAIYLLAWGDPEIRRLRGMEAVTALVAAATYRPEFVAVLGLTEAYWRSCIELVRRVPVYRYCRPRNWSPPDRLLAHMARAKASG